MTEQAFSEGNVNHYRELARQVVGRYNWQLVTPDELVVSALAMIANDDPNRLSRALVGAYCIAMYRAFKGDQGAEQQRRACEELGQALASLLVRNYPDLPPGERQDVAQNALERVWRARDTCHEPVAFLAFAASHLLSAVQSSRRQLHRLGKPLNAPTDPDDDPFDIPDQAPSLLMQVLDTERRSDFMRFLDDLRQARPRAKSQIDVLELRCLEDIGYAEIADRLHISLNNAYKKYTDICKTIRNDPELARRAKELGLV